MEPLSPVEIIRKYESVVLLDPNTTEDEQKTVFRRNRDILKKFSGEVTNLDTWGRRKLGNPIKKMSHAIYFHTIFEGKPEAIAEIERTMRIDDKVLRFMHTRLDDRTDLNKHLEEYREILTESMNREKEREAKFQKKKARPPRGPKQ